MVLKGFRRERSEGGCGFKLELAWTGNMACRLILFFARECGSGKAGLGASALSALDPSLSGGSILGAENRSSQRGLPLRGGSRGSSADTCRFFLCRIFGSHDKLGRRFWRLFGRGTETV